jgi:hypothetical protein
MFGGWRTIRGLAVLMAVGVLVPAVAWAGKRVISGQQSLQFKVTLKPNRAGARGGKFELRYTYTNPKAPGQQPPYNTKSITFTEPKGVVLNSSAAPSCRESAVINANGNASVCPPRSQVGTGTVVVNGRPAIPTLINGAVTVYNGVDDGGYGGFPKGSHELILYVKTSVGVNTVAYFHVAKAANGQLKLVAPFTKPAKPGLVPGIVTLQSLDLTIASSSKKPYLSNPGTCPGSWIYSITVTNWFNQPSITARDQVTCSR